MVEVGQRFTQLGYLIMPYSFAAYFLFRWLEYRWSRTPSPMVKGIWYAALGVALLGRDVNQSAIVMNLCFIEAWDLIIQQFELKRAPETELDMPSSQRR